MSRTPRRGPSRCWSQGPARALRARRHERRRRYRPPSRRSSDASGSTRVRNPNAANNGPFFFFATAPYLRRRQCAPIPFQHKSLTGGVPRASRAGNRPIRHTSKRRQTIALGDVAPADATTRIAAGSMVCRWSIHGLGIEAGLLTPPRGSVDRATAADKFDWSCRLERRMAVRRVSGPLKVLRGPDETKCN